MEEELTPLVRPDLPADLEYLRPLAKGKKGKVHLAREPELERLVVVKVLPPELSADETTRLRFEREARAAASLMHAHVVPVYCFGWLSDGSPYLVMAHVKGRTLTDHLEARGPMEETEALGLDRWPRVRTSRGPWQRDRPSERAAGQRPCRRGQRLCSPL